jgi:hypothetical protein
MHNITMPAAHSSFSRIRFAPTGTSLRQLRQLRQLTSCDQKIPQLEIRREEGLDLLEWLGLGRPDFGAIPARELAPRCRRRLWEIERNANPVLRTRTGQLLAVAEAAGEGMVLFG